MPDDRRHQRAMRLLPFVAAIDKALTLKRHTLYSVRAGSVLNHPHRARERHGSLIGDLSDPDHPDADALGSDAALQAVVSRDYLHTSAMLSR
jgi:hypothetical protein